MLQPPHDPPKSARLERDSPSSVSFVKGDVMYAGMVCVINRGLRRELKNMGLSFNISTVILAILVRPDTGDFSPDAALNCGAGSSFVCFCCKGSYTTAWAAVKLRAETLKEINSMTTD